MSWLTRTLTSSIGKKLLMALTGLFLIIFLIVHLMGNLQLFYNDGGYAFNKYSVFMTSNPLIKTISYLLYLSIVAHAVISLILTIRNRSSRPQRYASGSSGATSIWSSRNMGVLGTIVLIFLVVHMQNFWYQYHWGDIPYAKYEQKANGEIGKTTLDASGITKAEQHEEGVYKDLYVVVDKSFEEWWIVAIYVISMGGLAFHLSHGFQSAFQTLGLNHSKYTPFIKKLGLVFSIVVPTAFAALPIYFFMFK